VAKQPAGDGASLSDRQTVRYRGQRTDSGAVVLAEDDQGRTKPLPHRFDLRKHSPSGFEWGFSGSGPAQLALAILADALGAGKAQLCYQDFKFKVIAGFQADSWELSREEVLRWYSENAKPGDER
jgi:hypothetical protein